MTSMLQFGINQFIFFIVDTDDFFPTSISFSYNYNTIIRLSKTRQRTTGCQVNYLTKQKKKIYCNINGIECKIKKKSIVFLISLVSQGLSTVYFGSRK